MSGAWASPSEGSRPGPRAAQSPPAAVNALTGRHLQQLRGRPPCSTLLAGRSEYRLGRPARSPGNGVPGGRGQVVEDSRGNAQGRPHATPPGAGLKQLLPDLATRCGPNAVRERRRRPEPEPAVAGDRDESRGGEEPGQFKGGVCQQALRDFTNERNGGWRRTASTACLVRGWQESQRTRQRPGLRRECRAAGAAGDVGGHGGAPAARHAPAQTDGRGQFRVGRGREHSGLPGRTKDLKGKFPDAGLSRCRGDLRTSLSGSSRTSREKATP